MKLARSFAVAVALAAAALAAPASAAAAPNLVTRAVSDPPTAVKVGGAFAVRDAVANTGSAARGSDVRYYLAPDAKRSLAERRAGKDNPRIALGDVLMGGFRKVPALARGARSAAPRRPRTIVAVPSGTRPGLYYLLACADDRGAVAESAEHDNCRPAKKRVRVTDDAAPMFEGTFVDIAPEVPRAEDIADLERAKPLACMTLAAGKPLTKPQAIASARAYLTRVAGADAMAGFASRRRTATSTSGRARPLRRLRPASRAPHSRRSCGRTTSPRVRPRTSRTRASWRRASGWRARASP